MVLVVSDTTDIHYKMRTKIRLFSEMYNYSHIIFLQYREKSHDTNNDIYVRKKEPKLLFFDSSHFLSCPSSQSLNIIKMVNSPYFFAVSPPKIYTLRKKQ